MDATPKQLQMLPAHCVSREISIDVVDCQAQGIRYEPVFFSHLRLKRENFQLCDTYPELPSV